MHVSDGMLPPGFCAGGYAGSAALAWLSVTRAKKVYGNIERMVPRASVMAAAFFVVSWIHVPFPVVSVHPLLVGLMGALLGWMAFPAVMIALFFQAVMFGHGGFTTLGVNSVTMGGAALVSMAVYRAIGRGSGGKREFTAGLAAGFTGVVSAAAATTAVLLLGLPSYVDPEAERAAVSTMVLCHVPLAVVEGLFTASVMKFLAAVSPEMVEGNG